MRRNLITGILNLVGEWKEKPDDIEPIIHNYFGQLFTSSNPDLRKNVLESFVPCISPEMGQQLSLPYSSIEVTQALSQMVPLKSPSLDGLPVLFFHKYWNIIGSSISSCVFNFLKMVACHLN